MKSNNTTSINSEVMNIVPSSKTTCKKKILSSTRESLVECFLDVPESRLEMYVKSSKKNFVTDITAQVLKAKINTSALIAKSLKQIRAK